MELVDKFLVWYQSTHVVVQVGMWVLGGLLVFALIKRLLKVAILATCLLILIVILCGMA